MKVTYLTPEGYQRLKEELEYLRTVKRKEVAQRLHEALSEGGELIENSEYEAAKMEQAFVEGRIQELEHLLATAKVIYPSRLHLPRIPLRESPFGQKGGRCGGSPGSGGLLPGEDS